MAASGKKSRKKKSSSRRIPFSGVRLFLWLVAFGFTFSSLVAILFLPHKESTTADHSGKPVASQDAGTQKFQPDQIIAADLSSQPKPFVYEERIGADFDLRVWEADMAILQTLALLGHDKDRMVHKKIEPRFFYGTPYHFQEITIFTSNARDIFINKLEETLDRFLSNVSLEAEQPDNTWSISINGRETHLISLERIMERPPYGSGKLVLIIDDLGGSLNYARQLHSLDFPVVFSILPHMPGTEQVVEYARNNNVETMLHLPMEPLGYPQGIEPGPGALFVNMNSKEIRRRVADNLAQVPGAIGVNNHMGSRFTQDFRGMNVVFDEIQKQGLFFLDSMTTPKSVAEELAAKRNIVFLKRHVFLDNVQDKNAILFQLSKAENIAVKHGMAVAIGHPYPETLEALREWNRIRNRNVEVVRLSEFITTKKYHASK